MDERRFRTLPGPCLRVLLQDMDADACPIQLILEVVGRTSVSRQVAADIYEEAALSIREEVADDQLLEGL